MPHRLHLSFMLLDRLIDWFIPADLAGDREMRKQARMFLISHLLGPFIGSAVPAALYVLDPTPGYEVAVLAASIAAFWVFPFVLRATGRYNLLVLLSVQNLNFCILWSCYFYGGVSSPTLPWVLTIPLLSFFYVGASPFLRLAVLALFAADFAAFGLLSLFAHPVWNDMPAPSLQGIGIVSTAAASLYVTMMAFYYAKILASGVELESEVRGHLATAAELRGAAAEAERAGAAKAEFLAKMSHELRTPLNAVIGYSELLLEDAVEEGDEASISDLEKIRGAGRHLLRLVNEVLDLSKIEAGKMELFVEPAEIAPLLKDTVESCRAVAEKNGNRLSIEIADDLGTILCDTRKVHQAITHIVENAAKFTENGRIVVAAERRPTASGGDIVVTVQDTGIGIAPSVIPTLFEKFSVAEDSSASKYGGTGLGLALSQKLCRLMGGEVSAHSELGVGSCFTIRIPTFPVTSGATSPAEAQADPAESGGIGAARTLPDAA
jgi:signal transduction histidine kinase